MRDIMNSLDVKRAISPAAATTDNTAYVSQILDRRGYDAAVLILNLGSLADADATFVTLIEHGDQANLSDAAAVPDDMLNGLETAASFDFNADNKLFKIGYTGSKRYVRATVTPANNTGNVFLSAIWVLGKANNRPTANPPV